MMPNRMPVYEERYPAEFWFSCYSHFELAGDPSIPGEKLTAGKRLVFYDVETQRRAEEVGGWDRADLMLISVAVTYDDEAGFKVWLEKDAADMIRYMAGFDLVVSFNGNNFDSRVLSHYGDISGLQARSFDVAEYLSARLKHRVRLDDVAMATLQVGKSADGLQALEWWKEGRIDDIIKYCKQDVQVLRDIVIHGQEQGQVMVMENDDQSVNVGVEW